MSGEVRKEEQSKLAAGMKGQRNIDFTESSAKENAWGSVE
jgi:hypothetical protein